MYDETLKYRMAEEEEEVEDLEKEKLAEEDEDEEEVERSDGQKLYELAYGMSCLPDADKWDRLTSAMKKRWEELASVLSVDELPEEVFED